MVELGAVVLCRQLFEEGQPALPAAMTGGASGGGGGGGGTAARAKDIKYREDFIFPGPAAPPPRHSANKTIAAVVRERQAADRAAHGLDGGGGGGRGVDRAGGGARLVRERAGGRGRARAGRRRAVVSTDGLDGGRGAGGGGAVPRGEVAVDAVAQRGDHDRAVGGERGRGDDQAASRHNRAWWEKGYAVVSSALSECQLNTAQKIKIMLIQLKPALRSHPHPDKNMNPGAIKIG